MSNQGFFKGETRFSGGSVLSPGLIITHQTDITLVLWPFFEFLEAKEIKRSIFVNHQIIVCNLKVLYKKLAVFLRMSIKSAFQQNNYPLGTKLMVSCRTVTIYSAKQKRLIN